MPTTTKNITGNKLHKRHAVIHTGSIDVKIMRLEKRQVTMAVFRQLDVGLLFLSDSSLRGEPWGRVNYTWKDNPHGTGFHVVWQDGDCLKRSPMPDVYTLKNDSHWWRWFYDSAGWNSIMNELDRGGSGSVGSILGYASPYAYLDKISRWTDGRDGSPYRKLIRRYARQVRLPATEVVGADVNWKSIAGKIKQRLEYLHNQLKHSVVAMQDLDQLFIAT